MPKMKQRNIDNEELIGIGLRIKKSLHEKLKKEAFNSSRSINLIIENAISKYITSTS